MEYEIEYARLTSTPVFVHKGGQSEDLIMDNQMLFFDLYDQYLNDINVKYRSEYESYLRKIEAWDTKTCMICKSPLRMVYAYTEFWGCPNWQDGREHTRFQEPDPFIHAPRQRVYAHWLTDIIDISGFKKKVTAKPLLQFYLANGLEDLREKFGYGPSIKLIDGLIKVKKRSKEQELFILDALKKKEGKLLYQQCITYKLKGKKETFCIPDFIWGDDFDVYVLDAKLDYANDDKMDLYISLIEHIQKQHNNERPVYGAHIFYEHEEDYIRYSRHATWIVTSECKIRGSYKI